MARDRAALEAIGGFGPRSYFRVRWRVQDWAAGSQVQPYWEAEQLTPVPVNRLRRAGLVRDPERRPAHLRWMSEDAVARCYMPLYAVDEMPWVTRGFPENRKLGVGRHAEDLAIIGTIVRIVSSLAAHLTAGTIASEEALGAYLAEATR